MIDTAVVIATFGGPQKRAEAVKKAFNYLSLQSLPVQVMWYELTGSDGIGLFTPELSKEDVYYRRVYASERNDKLFQKEALWNLAVKEMPDYLKYIIFLDADVYTGNPDWFLQIRQLLDANPRSIVQPGKQVVTIKGDIVTETRLTWTGFWDLKPAKHPWQFNPGTVTCMTRETFDLIDGFNPYGFMYGGDTILLIETCSQARQYCKWHLENTTFRHVIRPGLIDLGINWIGTDDYIMHAWHDQEYRPYSVWESYLNKIKFNPKEWIKLDNNGLLSWVAHNKEFEKLYSCRYLVRSVYDERLK